MLYSLCGALLEGEKDIKKSVPIVKDGNGFVKYIAVTFAETAQHR